jgi:hypothetical protein
MKWMGIAITSVIMGTFFAVIAQTAFPALSPNGFTAAAIIGTAMILAIMIRLTLTAGTIEVRPPNEWDIHHKLRKS